MSSEKFELRFVRRQSAYTTCPSRISSGKLSAVTLLLATLTYKAKWYALTRSLEVKPRRRAQHKQFSLRFTRQVGSQSPEFSNANVSLQISNLQL